LAIVVLSILERSPGSLLLGWHNYRISSTCSVVLIEVVLIDVVLIDVVLIDAGVRS